MITKYPIVIIPLTEEDGGGFLGVVPDLLGCMSDGETQKEALENTQSAIAEWLETANRRGLDIPEPGSSAARAKRERERMVSEIRKAVTSVDRIETRLQELEAIVREIEEKTEKARPWSRFDDLAAIAVPIMERTQRLIN